MVFEFHFRKDFYLFYFLKRCILLYLFVYAQHTICQIITHEGDEIMSLKFVSIQAEEMQQQGSIVALPGPVGRPVLPLPALVRPWT